MQVTSEMMDLISSIEYEIGTSCYNGESYNGWTNEYGCSFRYPLTYETMLDGKPYSSKTRYRMTFEDRVTAENLFTACYKFGANELCIGKAIVDVLNTLERRFGISFNDLEASYQARKKAED